MEGVQKVSLFGFLFRLLCLSSSSCFREKPRLFHLRADSGRGEEEEEEERVSSPNASSTPNPNFLGFSSGTLCRLHLLAFPESLRPENQGGGAAMRELVGDRHGEHRPQLRNHHEVDLEPGQQSELGIRLRCRAAAGALWLGAVPRGLEPVRLPSLLCRGQNEAAWLPPEHGPPLPRRLLPPLRQLQLLQRVDRPQT